MPAPRAPSATVLLADDSAVARLALARRLRAEGLDVIEQASADPPASGVVATLACALLDLELGSGDGSELARTLRAERGDLPIAFFSASASADVFARARAVGPVFAKPTELEAAVAWAKNAANG